MSTEEFRVTTSGTTASFFLYEAVNRPCDFEGLIFGDYHRCLHREMSDNADAGDRNRPATIIHDIYIRRVLPTGSRFSFYDREYKASIPDEAVHMLDGMNTPFQDQTVDQPMDQSTSAEQAQSINGNSEGQPLVRTGFLGWFRFQKNPPRRPSDKHVCRALSDVNALRNFPILQDGAEIGLSSFYPWPGNGPLYLFSYPGSKNKILEWNIQINAFNSSAKELRPVRMQIRNLGDTTHADYWKLENGGAAAAGIARLMPGVVPNDASDRLLEATERMAENAKAHLDKAFTMVVDQREKDFKMWLEIQKTSPAALSTAPSNFYVRYGYAPSSDQELHYLLEHLRLGVGSGGQINVETESHNISQEDLFASSPAGDNSPDAADAAKEGGWTMVSPVSNCEMMEQDNVDLNVDVNTDPVRRTCKRPKENTSSSSSGAASDEQTDSPGQVTEAMSKLGTSSSSANPGPQNCSAKLPTQQKKKSKSTDSGSSSENQESTSASNRGWESPSVAGVPRQNFVSPSVGRGTTPSPVAPRFTMPPRVSVPIPRPNSPSMSTASAIGQLRPKGRGRANNTTVPPGLPHPPPGFGPK